MICKIIGHKIEFFPSEKKETGILYIGICQRCGKLFTEFIVN